MPRADTFSSPPIAAFIQRYLWEWDQVSVDPFARNSQLARYRNDLDPNTTAEWHEAAEVFLIALWAAGVRADLVLFDPPYSPRQIAECYRIAGRPVSQADTQNAALCRRVRMEIERIVNPGAVVLSFGWNSTGMGKEWETLELLLVCHGGAHNDTICLAQRRRAP